MAEVLNGVLGGASIGAKIGTEIAPGIGTILGAIGGGFIGGVGGGKKQKAVNEAMASLEAIPSLDPNMADFRDQLGREKKAVESGFSTDFQVARDIIGQSEAGGMSVAAEMAMTNPALSLMMMNQVSSQSDASINKALGTISTQKMGYSQMISGLIEREADRSLQLDLLKSQYKMAQATANKKDFNANMMALATKFGPEMLANLFQNKFTGKIPEGTVNYE
jgi:hypothetical protein